MPFAPVAVAGGLGLFFLGLSAMRQGVRRLAGARLRRALAAGLRSPGRAVAAGLFLTFALQSTGLVAILLMQLLEVDAIPFSAALAAVVGGNVGAALTVPLLALKAYTLAPGVIAAGLGLLMAAPRPTVAALGRTVTGFGITYAGIAAVSAGAEGLARHPFLIALMEALRHHPWPAGMFGALLTAVVQSNGVANGILLALGRRGLMGTATAGAVVVGANVGSGTLALAVAAGSNRPGRALAVANFLVNLAGAALLLPVFGAFVGLAHRLGGDLPRTMAVAHVLFNLTASAALLPVLGPLARLSDRLALVLYGRPFQALPLSEARHRWRELLRAGSGDPCGKG